VLHVEDGEWDI